MASERGEGEGRSQRGGRCERWTSSRLLPDGQGSEWCCASAPLSLGQEKCEDGWVGVFWPVLQ